MPATGAISDRVRDILPWTWDALLNDADKYGPVSLQRRIDYVKAVVFGPLAFSEENETNYDVLTQEYLAKLAALQLIPAGIEFWSNSSLSVSTQGYAGAEHATYPDRARMLEQLREQLLMEVRDLGELIAPYTRRRSSSPRVNTSADDMITEDPQSFELPGVPWNRENRKRFKPAVIGR